MPFTYILRCADDTLYVGHTEDLALRERTHNDGKGAKYTAARRPVRMVYAEEHASIASAIAREQRRVHMARSTEKPILRGKSPLTRRAAALPL